MSFENERDVEAQMDAAGLMLERALQVGTAKPVRCPVAGRRGKPGWYHLSEFPIPDENAIIIVGAFGEWNGADHTTIAVAMPEKVCQACGTAMRRTLKKCPDCGATDLRTREFSKEQKAELRRKMAERKKALAAATRAKEQKAAIRALRAWRACTDEPPASGCGYLERKKVGAHGVRFSENGTLVVPITDVDGKIHGLQFIYDKADPAHKSFIARNDGIDKKCWPYGMGMQGGFHILGRPPRRGEVCIVTEGYATAASILESGAVESVAMTFFANNVLPALKQLHAHYRGVRWLVAADDDYLCRCGADVDGTKDAGGRPKKCNHQVPVAEPIDAPPSERKIVPCAHCGKPHKKINTGVTVAMEAAFAIDGVRWIVPHFSERIDAKTGKPRKWTDFNDLHVEESLQAVETQLRDAIEARFPPAGSPGAAAGAPAVAPPTGGGEGDAAPRLMTVDDAIDRYSLIYGVENAMFDHYLYKLVPKSCVLDCIPGRPWEEIKRHPELRRVDIDNVGFDPSGDDERVLCNMWGGWPTVPKKGSCEKQLELLNYLCSHEQHGRDIVRWVLCWMAYIVQNPGIKMKTAIVMHGPTRVGKNLLFEESFAKIFGPYGFTIGQSDLESQFNEWASRKLFIIANEVVARQEIFHQKGKMRGLITDPTININPKTKIKYSERNHINLIFFSNELQPVVPDPDDERFLVIRTPKRRPKEFYLEVVAEIENGGIAALHDFLLNYDVGDFHVSTPPLMTMAKESLIEISKENPDRFADAWMRGELDVPVQACALADLYRVYVGWCRAEGERYIKAKNMFSGHIDRRDDIVVTRKGVLQDNGKSRTDVVVLPDGDNDPGALTWMEFLAGRLREFRNAMDDGDDRPW